MDATEANAGMPHNQVYCSTDLRKSKFCGSFFIPICAGCRSEMVNKMKVNHNSKIYIAGHSGLFGSALVRALRQHGFDNLLTISHKYMDLTNETAVMNFFLQERPDYVYVAAAKVGGIHANSTQMADFAMENLQITCTVLKAAHVAKVKKLLYLGSSCVYPCKAPQPVKEEFLLTGPLEPTNEGYGIAKVAGVRMCDYYKRQYGDDFISCMPANVYGENDSFDEKSNHVIPALIQRFHKAKTKNIPCVEIWGTGNAEREFLYIDDAAEACLYIMDHYTGPGTINIGTGIATSIRDLAEMIAQTVGYQGKICFDTLKPDGMPRRLLDSTRINAIGWFPKIGLAEGLKKEYEWYIKNVVKDERKC